MHELGKPGATKETIEMDGKTAQHCQQAIITSDNAEHQTATLASHTTEATPSEDQNPETESLFHSYSCFKLSFLTKMAFLQNIKALGYDLSEEDVKREKESMEEARVQALKTWEQIRDKGFSYDDHGFEYLRSSTQHCHSACHQGKM